MPTGEVDWGAGGLAHTGEAFAVVTPDLVIVGPASSWLEARVRDFCEALRGSPWGNVPPARLVVATDFPAAMREYLPPARYAAWVKRQRTRGSQVTNVGMGFRAADGVATAVATALPESTNRAELLSLCCHELCELSIDTTGGRDHETLASAMSGLIWSEHVVERRRTEVFVAKGWPSSVMDRSFLSNLWNDYTAAVPNLIRWAVRHNAVPDDLYGHWQIMTREVVCAYGRAQSGNSDEEREIERFLAMQNPAVSGAWLDLMLFCDRAFGSPELLALDLDMIGEEGWTRIWHALRGEWNTAYFAAQV
jgi:hypothetical protein